MKVKDLIKELKLANPEATVIVPADNIMELGQVKIDLTTISEYFHCKRVLKHTRDAIDNIPYSKKVWQLTGGIEAVVFLS